MLEGTAELAMSALERADGLTRPSVPERRHHDQWEMRVERVEQLTSQVRRLIFSSPRFCTWRPVGPDEYFGLLFPPPGGPLVLPTGHGLNVRAMIAELPEADRPGLRWYTVRRHDAQAGTILVDVVTHGDSGPGSAWVAAARPGDIAGFRTGAACHRGFRAGERQLLIADETALPALAAIGEAFAESGQDVDIKAIIETPGVEAEAPLDPPFPVTRVARVGRPGEALLQRVSAHSLQRPDYAWICGEQMLAAELRRFCVRKLGVGRGDVFFSGYWTLGAPRG